MDYVSTVSIDGDRTAEGHSKQTTHSTHVFGIAMGTPYKERPINPADLLMLAFVPNHNVSSFQDSPNPNPKFNFRNQLIHMPAQMMRRVILILVLGGHHQALLQVPV